MGIRDLHRAVLEDYTTNYASGTVVRCYCTDWSSTKRLLLFTAAAGNTAGMPRGDYFYWRVCQ